MHCFRPICRQLINQVKPSYHLWQETCVKPWFIHSHGARYSGSWKTRHSIPKSISVSENCVCPWSDLFFNSPWFRWKSLDLEVSYAKFKIEIHPCCMRRAPLSFSEVILLSSTTSICRFVLKYWSGVPEKCFCRTSFFKIHFMQTSETWRCLSFKKFRNFVISRFLNLVFFLHRH